MKAAKSKNRSQGAVAILEEAFLLLRHAPLGVLVLYYVGALPFVLGLLYFWADMSRGAYANDRLAGMSLLLALLFVWMKAWHAVFCRNLLAVRSEDELPEWTWGRFSRMLLVQSAIQPWALLVRPVALLIALPYVWVKAFFENVSILGDGSDASIRGTFRRAREQALLWPMANAQTIGLLAVFGLFVFLNVALGIVALPALLKMFLGVETRFSTSSYSIFNTTFFVAALAGAWLCVNPILKAVYVLRCFYGAAQHTGADLLVELKKTRSLALFSILLFALMPVASAAPTPPPQTSIVLDEQIQEVLQRDEFVWREPREERSETEKQNGLDRFFKSIGKMVSHALQPAKRWVKTMLHRLEDWLKNRKFQEQPDAASSFDWAKPAKWLLIFLICTLVPGLVFLWRKMPRKGVETTPLESSAASPDLNDENISAAQLPEDGWLRLAQEMWQAGDLRLALRAFYLATLSHFSDRQWITLAKHKSNRDYEGEMRRRARSPEVVQTSFSETLRQFERVWYGDHPATPALLENIKTRLETIRQI